MNDARKKYPTPTVTEIRFADKNLVSFAVCSKQTKTEGDSVSCCNILPDNIPNDQTFDPS